MTASRADLRRVPAGIVLAGILSCMLPAAAAQPLQLLRPTPQAETRDAPDQTSPGLQPGSQPGSQQAAPGGAPDASSLPPVGPRPGMPDAPGTALPMRPLDTSAIMVNPLEAVDPDAIGVLGEAEGGFPADLWQGADWGFVSGLLPRVPERTLSPAVRGLAVRLLLSRASVPSGKPPAASLVALRLDRLLAMGALGEALSLLALVPEHRRDEIFARTEIEAMFYDNRNSDACGRVRAGTGEYDGDYWKQAQAFCLALAGEGARASLIADLLRERANEIDPAFFVAIETLGGMKWSEPVSLKAPSGLLLAMIRAARIRIADDIGAVDRPIALRAVALSPNAGQEVRLAAAEKAFGTGALSGDEMIRFYQGVSFTPEELASPISRAEANWGPRGRAVLLRAAAVQDVALARAEVLQSAWSLGREKGGYEEVVRASVPIVESIPPAAELTWFAADAARVLFGAGRIDEAMGWYAMVAADRDRIDEAREAEAALWPLALLAADGEIVSWSAERLQAWYAALQREAPEHALPRALALFAMLDATGRDLPPALWRTLLQGPVGTAEPGLNAAWTAGLDGAASGGRLGETVLLTVVGAGTAGDDGFASVAAARQAVSALRRVGLDADARRLAIETVMAAGL
ncbi:MAG: hypothetical protein WD470_04855 [Rhodospirillaceae bacterium]